MTTHDQTLAFVPSPQTVPAGGHLRLTLIGPMQAYARDGRSVLPLGRKTRALLAVLALSAPRPVVRARLAELLWSRRLEEQARASLRQEIHRLLESLHPDGLEVIRVTRDHLTLQPDAVRSDVDEVMRTTPSEPAALSLLSNDLLAGFEGIDPALDLWLGIERERLRDHARGVAQSLLDERASPEAMLPVARQLIGIDKAHEAAWRVVVRAHAARGERGMAIQAYERCRAVLAETMSAQPAAETQRLIAAIRAGSAQPLVLAPHTGSEARREPVPALAGRARLGVLPLELFGVGIDDGGLSAGLAQQITAALSQCRWIGLASPSALAQAGTRDEATLRDSFGLDYLLDGSVQRVGKQLRTALRLLDLRDRNRVVYVRHFDHDGDDLLGMQDQIAAELAAQIDPEIQVIEGARAAHIAGSDRTAYHLVWQALALTVRLTREEFTRAGLLLTQAVEMEPDYAAAHAARAYWAMFALSQGWADQPATMTGEAGDCAERAITLDPQDARGLTIAGHVRASVFRSAREALELHGRALSLNPNLAMAWGLSAVSYVYLDELDEAERRFARYKRLTPNDRHGFFYDTCQARLEISRKHYEQATQVGRRATKLHPFYAEGLQVQLSALGHAGLFEEAAGVRRRLAAIRPGFTITAARVASAYARSETFEHFADGLRRAGLAEQPPKN